MTRMLVLPFAAALAVPAIAFAADAPRLGTLAGPDAARPLLDGRLVLRVPAIAKTATGPVRSDDSRLVIDAGEERLEIHATELFALAGADFAESATRVVQGWNRGATEHLVAPIALASGLRGVDVVPATPDRRPTGAFVRGLFVASPDGTVQYLEARANAPGARDFAAADALAARVLRSASAGTRSLVRTAVTCRLTTPNADLTVFAKVPAGIATGLQHETDRSVHRFQPVVALGENAPSLTVTFAKDARYLHDRLNRGIKPKVEAGTLVGQKVLWHSWSAPREAAKQHLEALVTLGTPAHPLTAHVLVLHRGGDQADALRAIAESMIAERRPQN